MAWWKIKAYRNNLAKKRRNGTPSGKPTSDTEHPVMETHPGARVEDPETGEKPAPVRKPRVKKPKPEPQTPASTGNSPGPSADTTDA